MVGLTLAVRDALPVVSILASACRCIRAACGSECCILALTRAVLVAVDTLASALVIPVEGCCRKKPNFSLTATLVSKLSPKYGPTIFAIDQNGPNFKDTLLGSQSEHCTMQEGLDCRMLMR